MTVQSFITIKWQDKKLSQIKIFRLLVSEVCDHDMSIILKTNCLVFTVIPRETVGFEAESITRIVLQRMTFRNYILWKKAFSLKLIL